MKNIQFVKLAKRKEMLSKIVVCQLKIGRGGVTELVNVSVVHPRDPCSNVGSDGKYFLILFVLSLS